MKKLLLKSFSILVILSLFFVTGCKKETHKGVEINGVKWATCNVDKPGAFTANPEDAGMLYQWNRKTGWSSVDPLVNHAKGTTWDDSSATGDSWETMNNPCPAGWRVPTYAEYKSLLSSGSEWNTLNDVNGRYFGAGDQRVFLPAAGSRNGTHSTIGSVGVFGFYWTGTPNILSSEGACSMFFNKDKAYDNGYGSRNFGYSVRCVAEED